VPHPKRQPPATAEGAATPPRRSLLARLPWTPIVLSLLVILTSAAGMRPVRDAATLADVSEAYLAKPTGYVALAPISAVFDSVLLMSVRQHIALFAGLIVVFAAWRVFRQLRSGSTMRAHLLALSIVVGVFLLTYAAAILVSRPMAYLATQDPTVMIVDFHSHTSASGDARRGFSVEDNRDWHGRAGYDVTVITDHASVAGAERGVANNTAAGLDEPMVVQAIEATWTGEHVSVLGAQRTYSGMLTPNLRDIDPDALRLGSLVASREPIVIWHHPRDLNRLPPAAGPRTAGVRAVEIANGAPDNMDDLKPRRAQIVALAQTHDLMLTTGSDNHGWGYTAPAWTLMRPPVWRGLGSDALALTIERVIRDGGFRGSRAVERTTTYPASVAGLTATIVSVPLTMLRTLSSDERVMWLVWIWAVWGLVRWATHRRARS
jgi:hypothetical protein